MSADVWTAGDRFQIQPAGNCDLDQAEGLIFELTYRGRRRGRRPKGGVQQDGWFFYAPSFDEDRNSRWIAVDELNQACASGEYRRVPRSVGPPTSTNAVDPHAPDPGTPSTRDAG